MPPDSLDTILGQLPAPVPEAPALTGDLELAQSIDVTAPKNPTATPQDGLFDPRLAFELALEQEDPDVVRRRYNITNKQWDVLRGSQAFKNTVTHYKDMLTEAGDPASSYRLKVQIQAEASLQIAWSMLIDRRTPPAIRAKLIEWHGKISGYEPKPQETADGFKFHLEINL